MVFNWRHLVADGRQVVFDPQWLTFGQPCPAWILHFRKVWHNNWYDWTEYATVWDDQATHHVLVHVSRH